MRIGTTLLTRWTTITVAAWLAWTASPLAGASLAVLVVAMCVATIVIARRAIVPLPAVVRSLRDTEGQALPLLRLTAAVVPVGGRGQRAPGGVECPRHAIPPVRSA